jgi:hypothetical protein
MKKEKVKEEVSVDFQGKTNAELEEIAKTLEAQANQYQTLAIKAQGALEVLAQMLDKKEVNES